MRQHAHSTIQPRPWAAIYVAPTYVGATAGRRCRKLDASNCDTQHPLFLSLVRAHRSQSLRCPGQVSCERRCHIQASRCQPLPWPTLAVLPSIALAVHGSHGYLTLHLTTKRQWRPPPPRKLDVAVRLAFPIRATGQARRTLGTSHAVQTCPLAACPVASYPTHQASTKFCVKHN
jgi:hypothetical protein